MKTDDNDKERLQETAAALVAQCRGNVDRAARLLATRVRKNRKLLVAMSLSYLQHLNAGDGQPPIEAHCNGATPAAAGKDQGTLDDLRSDVLPAATYSGSDHNAVDAQVRSVAPAVAGEDQADLGTHRMNVPPATEPSVTVQKHKRRTPEQKRLALAAKALIDESIFEMRKIGNRRLGKIHMHELPELKRERANDSASYLRLGTSAVHDVLFITKMENHGSTSDQNALVPDVHKAANLMRMDTEAEMQAPRLIEYGMRQYADMLEKGGATAAEIGEG